MGVPKAQKPRGLEREIESKFKTCIYGLNVLHFLKKYIFYIFLKSIFLRVVKSLISAL